MPTESQEALFGPKSAEYTAVTQLGASGYAVRGADLGKLASRFGALEEANIRIAEAPAPSPTPEKRRRSTGGRVGMPRAKYTAERNLENQAAIMVKFKESGLDKFTKTGWAQIHAIINCMVDSISYLEQHEGDLSAEAAEFLTDLRARLPVTQTVYDIICPLTAQFTKPDAEGMHTPSGLH